MIGTPPSPRTFHTNSAVIGDRLYVFGGGNKGVDPVQDQQLHVFDTGEVSSKIYDFPDITYLNNFLSFQLVKTIKDLLRTKLSDDLLALIFK